ncbi:MAG: outer membrane beta-barrel protein, partial [Betaproteobacteria bacterium]|nr:outer membrane beta-barrel protein [Betaproteobacteria bacterium]
TFNQASLTASYLPSSGFGGSVTLLGGSDATYLPGGTQLGVETAFVQYATGNLTLDAGRLPTLAGAEVVNPMANNEISRSLLFFDLEPIYHTGVRAAYAVNGALTVTGGVNEGFNHATQVTGNSKTVELGASGSPTKMFSYSAAYYYTGTGSYYGGLIPSKEQLLDLVGTLNVTDALNFGLNIDLVSKGDYNGVGSGSAKANGYALYANYAINDQFTLSGRGEYLDDKQGLVSGTLGSANKIKELTVALNYTPVKNVKLSAELRQDKSDLMIFDNASKGKQTSFELLAAYAF